MILVITLTKTVVDKAEAEVKTQQVRDLINAEPNVDIKAETIDTLPTQ